MRSRYIGDKAFYKRVLAILIPMMVQNGISNFVNLLDNIMVGQIGTEQMSGVAIANNINFIFFLAVFGALSGAGIFGAQFFGSGNTEYFRYTFRFKFVISTLLGAAAIAVFLLFKTQLAGLFLHESESAGDLALTLASAEQYFTVFVVGILPFAWAQMYASTLRESGQTVVPMAAAVTAVLVNLAGNYVLIFGHFGAPALGVRGAAAATVLSRFVELAILVIWTARHKAEHPFIRGAFSSLYIPANTVRSIIVRGTPLLFNEVLFSLGIVMVNQAYSYRGLDTVAAQNIASTISNLFSIVFMSMGGAISIILGQHLGAGRMEQARDEQRKLAAFSILMAAAVGAFLALTAPLYPRFYRTSDSVRSLAAAFIRINALCMPFFSYTHACYFTLRSGGKTFITFLFDCCYIWAVCVPLANILVHATPLGIVAIFAAGQFQDVLKCGIGYWLVRKGVWINNIAETSM